MKIINVKIKDLKFSEYNPRKWDEKAIYDLKTSIQRFGLVDPIIVNSAENRKNIVIGGHFRLKIMEDLGYEEVPVVYVNIPNVNEEKELNLRLNKNLGDWDWELLADFDEEILLESGFEKDDLIDKFKLNEIEDIGIDSEQVKIISVELPEAPKLKDRMAFYCRTISEYEKIKKFFKKGKNELDIDKLLSLIS